MIGRHQTTAEPLQARSLDRLVGHLRVADLIAKTAM